MSAKTILYIEDNEDNLYMLSNRLKRRGYDVIEAVAAKPWGKDGKVGMVGISFSGISQLFVGGAAPPHLAAITPLSVIASIYESPGYPGGIFNNGFAQSWLQDRANDAKPAPEGGQSWAIKRVNRSSRPVELFGLAKPPMRSPSARRSCS